MNKIKVVAIESEEILKLVVQRPMVLTDKALRATINAGHVRVLLPHITLVRLDEIGVQLDLAKLPQPPSEIELQDQVFYVQSEFKQSCYANVVQRDQELLAAYVLKCEEVAGCKLLDPHRQFHLSLTNAGGGSRDSIGEPWKFRADPV